MRFNGVGKYHLVLNAETEERRPCSKKCEAGHYAELIEHL